MKIYENLTFLSHNYKEALNFYKKNKNKKINILYSFKSVLWQGPSLVKDIEKSLKKKKNEFYCRSKFKCWPCSFLDQTKL